MKAWNKHNLMFWWLSSKKLTRMEDNQRNNQRNKLHLQRKKLSKQILAIHQDQIKLLQRSKKNSKIKITVKNSNSLEKTITKVEAVTSATTQKKVLMKTNLTSITGRNAQCSPAAGSASKSSRSNRLKNISCKNARICTSINIIRIANLFYSQKNLTITNALKQSHKELLGAHCALKLFIQLTNMGGSNILWLIDVLGIQECQDLEQRLYNELSVIGKLLLNIVIIWTSVYH